MRLRNLAGHTINLDLLAGGWGLDAGCLGFEFSKMARNLGTKVLAIDPSPRVSDPRMTNIIFQRLALVGCAVESALYAVTRTPEGNYLCDNKRGGRLATYSVPCRTISQLMDEHKIEEFDFVKLDIEGTEYEVLRNWPGPVAKQISVEFHDFLKINPCPVPELFHRRLRSHLSRWYEAIHWPNHRCDCLFQRKKL